jgi:orotidine-5'-phosphate decarboxylase
VPFANDLLDAVRAKKSRVCVGLDPMPERLPAAVREADTVTAIRTFCLGVLDAVAEHAACVKLQSAYFEAFRARGVDLYFQLIQAAKERGLLVIGDAKRGDIGPTSAAYAAGHLDPHPDADRATADALTVNPMLGPETIRPFINAAARNGKGLFVLVRTSNPDSTQLQDIDVGGKTWSEHLADALSPIAAEHLTGGVSLLGAVVGATQPETMVSLRRRLPNSVLLLPGYGAQGGTAETARAAFAEGTAGAIVSASRSVLYPEASGNRWQADVEAAVVAMKEDLHRVVG